MYCTQCGAEVSGDYCTTCGAKLPTHYKMIREANQMNVIENEPDTMTEQPFYKKKLFYIIGIPVTILWIVIIAVIVNPNNTPDNNVNQKEIAQKTSTQSAAAESNKETFEHNSYYDIVEEARTVGILGNTVIYQKVMAKRDVTIEATLIAYDSNQNVIGKSTDSIILTKGKTNYFRFYFSEDISTAAIQSSAIAKEVSFLVGERNAVEMVAYNQSGSYLYITLKQTENDIGSFAKFKILYYKNNEIIGDDYGYLSLQAQNLNGKGSTDVVKVLNYNYMDFDKIEFIYEP